MPSESRREQHTVDTLTRANLQFRGELSLGITAASLNGNQHHPKQYQGIDIHEISSTSPYDENSERLANGTSSHGYASTVYMSSGQQAANGLGHTTSRDIDLHTGDHTHHVSPDQAEIQPPASIYSSLGEYVAQQQSARNYALEFWRAQSSRDGPLRVIPELLGFSDWSYSLGNDHDRESETGATVGGSL
ncbi:hypothetical protein F5Y06DRAFT_280065 [Hypoxylon sp. FL0890]|nr:hypothetical protein F5Y06DRAFT_280065 [Hypoxylon sp. FL0890]